MNWFRPHFNMIDYSKLPSPEVTLLLNAHAHNDSLQQFPLMKALHHGYTFIEADVHLIKGKLYAYHRRPFFPNKKRTLDQLYLKPLFDIFQQRGGFIFPSDIDQQTLHLLIDVKTDPVRTYEVLEKELKPYVEMLTTYKNEQVLRNAVSIMITGNRSLELLNSSPFRLACVDGRVEDLEQGYSTTLMPLVSASYTKLFGWFSKYRKHINDQEIQQLQDLILRTQGKGKMLRLWNSPESKKI
ncbi:MAG: glycerophosphoryl diester phosphodiesterase [Polaribacter sp.]|jgi:glycerophosphoryl diester phosphodiesterase